MKKHLFMAALATTAMVACTQEDFESTNASSGQVSPISFTVTTDMDAQTRAEFLDSYAIHFERGDQMSLFHGIGTVPASGISSFAPSYVENAIYKANEGNGEDGLTFTTHSMVKPGAAIMVYPCDTTFQYLKDKGLYVTIPTEQSKENILGRIPLMSELLTIPEWKEFDSETGEGSTTAGYGRDYPITLKQVATVFTLNTNYGVSDAYGIIKTLENNGEIAPITIDKVTIESSAKFNSKALVKYEGKTTVQGDNWPEATDDGFEWSYVSNVYTQNDNAKEGDEVESVASLSSTFIGDVSENEMGKVEFLLLPQEAVTGDEEVAKLTGKIVVDTYYGQVSYNEKAEIAERGIMYKEGWEEDEYLNVAKGLNEVVSYTTKTKNSSGSTFYNEPVGVHVTRVLDVDLYDLDMSKVHIKTDKQLQNILKVYDALGFDEKYSEINPLVLTVDGDKDQQEFRMSMESVRLLQSEAYRNIRIRPCQETDEVCGKIVLYHEAETDVVPSIEFVRENAVSLVLDEGNNWTWENGVEYNSNIATLINRGTLNLDNGDEILNNTNTKLNFSVLNEGTINVSGLVRQQCSLNNFGTINIEEGAEYRADGYEVVITNNATSATALGLIYNSGILATSNKGTINNYGYIENMLGTTGNMTYVTTNATSGASFSSVWSKTNKIGTIRLKTAGDNISVSNATNQGFIQYVYTGTNYETPEVCKYNYLIVTDDITFSAEANEVMYLEIQNNDKTDMPVVTNPQAERFLNLTGFILKGYANLHENNKLVTDAAYIEGALYYGGLFCPTGQTGSLPKTEGVYFGNSEPAEGDNTYLVEY